MSRSLQFLVLLVLVCFATAIHIRDWQKATGDVAVSAWARDASNNYYFATAIGITRVKSDLTRDLTLPLLNNEAMVHAICLDTNYGYAIVNSTTGAQLSVIQFNLGSATNFSRTATLNLFSVEFGQLGGICNFDAATPTALYVGITHTTLPAQIVQVKIAPFSLTRLGAISLQEGEVQVNAVCVDTAAGVAYYGLNSNKVVAINTAAFTRNNALSGTLNTTATGGATTVTACAFDSANALLYFGFSNGFLMKVSKTNLASQITNVPLVQSGLIITGLAVDALNQIYGTGRTASQGVIFRVDVPTFQTVNTLTLDDSGTSPIPVNGAPLTSSTGATLRFNVAHSGTSIVGKMWTYDNTLTRINATTIVLNNPLSSSSSTPVDDGAGSFWITTSTPAAVIRVRKADWAQTQRCLLNAGDGSPVSVVVDPSSVMVGTSTGNIVRFDLNCGRFTWNPTNVFGVASRGCNFLLQDNIGSAGNVYCVSNSYTAIARINKADQTMQVTRVLFLNEGVAQAAVLDATNQLVYIMTQNSPNPVLVKIRLSDFVRVSVPQGLFADTVNPITAAAAMDVDAAGNIYVVSTGATSYVRVFKYSSTFTLLSNGTYSDPQFNDINGFSLILSGTTLYITSAQGAATTPSKLIRVDANTLNRIDSMLLTMSQSPARTFANQTNAAWRAVVGTSTLTLVGRDATPVLFSVALCADGQYFDEPSQTCICCAAGQWLPRETGQCLTCPQGFTCPTTCTANPVGCPAGSYCPQGSITALPCAAGYTSTALSGNCTICPAGSYCTNSTLITPCPAGTYQNFTGMTSVSACTACPVGQYSTTVGSSSPVTCIYCPAGQYSTVFGAASSAACQNCYPGSTSDPTRTFCTPCTPGTANGVAGGLCGNCAAGTYSNSFGALKCINCPAGQFNPNTTATYCQLCLPGTSQSATGQISCTDCLAGTYSNIAGAMSCLNCPTGTYNNQSRSTSCQSCPAGYSSGQGTGTDGQQYCGACPPGTFSNAVVGTNQCFACPTGTFNANYNATSCSPCAAGYIPTSTSTGIQNNGATACQPCAAGQYKTVAASGDACINCPIGYYQPNIASSSCLPCPDGSSSAAGSSSCTICTPGKYASVANNIAACTNCPAGHVSGYGANQCTKCASGFTSDAAQATCIACPMGQYGRDGLCFQCPAGTYQPQTGQTSCLRCPAGTAQGATGQVGCVACAAGTYAAASGATACVNCLEGTYSTGQFQIGFYQIGATQCSICPAGFTSPTASSQCNPCAAGRYSVNPGATACEACAAGYVNPYIQQTSCQACPPGTTATAAASTQCSSCTGDSFTDVAGLPFCKNCPVATYANVSIGATSCSSCGDGEILLAPAGNSIKQCQKCAPGTYLPVGVKATACFTCPAGTYAVGYGNTACTPCPAGTFVAATGATALGQCSKCAIGSYSSAGSSACRTCPYGSYSFPASQPGASSCKFCPSGYFSNINSDGNVGDTVCLPCPAGTYVAREGSHNIINTTTSNNYNIRDSASTQDSCIPCPVGTFAATAGSAACLPCPQSTYADVTGSAQCKACPGNSFNTQFGSTHFNNCSSTCPSGYTNYAQNTTGISKSDSCVACPAGTFFVSFSQPCQPCPAGTYNPRIAQTQCFDCANSTAIGASVCCKSVSNGNSTSIVCSSASYSKMFNPMFILAAVLLALSALL